LIHGLAAKRLSQRCNLYIPAGWTGPTLVEPDLSVIEAENMDQAVRLVADTPCARAKGAIEIRPIMLINDAEWKRTVE
jgi:hypothetical protein